MRPNIFSYPQLDDSVRATVAEMQRLGVAAHILSPAEIEARFPFLDLDYFSRPRPWMT
ncbi:MAG: FAD-dependent oxidoreductase [Caldilineaceae bacterium]